LTSLLGSGAASLGPERRLFTPNVNRYRRAPDLRGHCPHAKAKPPRRDHQSAHHHRTLRPHAADALSLLQTLRQQSINPETDAAIKRVALLLLRDDPAGSVPGSTETRLLH
jgi:hypothetical protein